MSWRSVAVALAGVLAVSATPATAQRSVTSDRDTAVFALPDLQVMLDTARALYTDLQEDPLVLYSLGFGPPADVDSPDSAYPWNAVSPTSDSTVNVIMPGNLREADRAYYNYSVMRMRVVRTQDPDASCEALVVAEEVVLSSFVDGWILARTLFGGPGFGPMDELVFAREAGLLRALLAARGDSSIGACAAEWAEANPAAVAGYEDWRATRYPEAEPEMEAPLEELADEEPADAADPTGS